MVNAYFWRWLKMTIQALEQAIIRLILKRQSTDQNDLSTHNYINSKLSKLYEVKENYYKTLNN